jgi:hypothetical protein
MKYAPLAVLSLVVLGASGLTAQVIYNSASTAAEGAANGAANIIQAQGQRNLSNSQARINNQDAYSMALDNSTKSVNTFWENKSIYNQHLDVKLQEIDAKRAAYLANNGLQSLTPQEFDRTTGTIMWLKILDQDGYAQYRSTLDKLFKQRAYAGALTGEEYMQATAACKDWRKLITSQKDEYPGPILSQMLRFILKVNRELDDNLG